jgi:hypothetical protein
MADTFLVVRFSFNYPRLATSKVANTINKCSYISFKLKSSLIHMMYANVEASHWKDVYTICRIYLTNNEI